MKKILIISERFAPYFTIGAIRPTKIAKYLSRDYEVSVFTSEKHGKKDEILLKDLKYISHFYTPSSDHNGLKLERTESSAMVQPADRSLFKCRLIEKVKELRNLNVFKPFVGIAVLWYQNRFYRKGKSHIQTLCENQFDIIFSTYSTYSSHKLAARLKSVSPKSFWIADYRDPVYSPNTSLVMKPWAKTFARRVTGKADVITAVSKGCLDNLLLEEHPRKVVIPNGFDVDDISDIKHFINDKFTLSYLGRLYAGKQDLSPIFVILRELITDNQIDSKRIKIFYAGPSKSVFFSQAEKCKLLDITEVNDSIPRIESMRKQLESRLLILATWNNTGKEGIVTGKFLEYMMMEKPIIALVAGNLGDSTVKSMMLKGNLGICYEEANKVSDYTLLKNYVLKQYNLFINNESPEFHPNQEFIQKYNYKNIAQEFINLFPKQ